MNRFLAVLAVAFLFPLFSLAQEGFQDVIYLKKGGFVKGSIVEQIPHKSVKILLQDGMVASFKVEEIEKFSKERYVEELADKKPRNSYVGFSAGLSMPIGSYANKSDAAATLGMHVNIAQVGYMITPCLGLAATWYGAVNDYETSRSMVLVNGIPAGTKWNVVAYGGTMIGPLYSQRLLKKLHLDLRVMGGYTKLSLRQRWGGLGEMFNSDDVTTGSVSAGAIIRYDLFRLFSVMACAEYFGCSPHLSVSGYSYQQPINTLSLGVGVAFRIQSINMVHVLPFLAK